MTTAKFLLSLALCAGLFSCATFHDAPDVSVWAGGAWLIPALLFAAAAWFVFVSWRASRSRTWRDVPGGPRQTDLPPVRSLWKQKQMVYAVALIIAGLVVIWFFNSDHHR